MTYGQDLRAAGEASEFIPDACNHAYAYDANGLLLTDTASNGTSTWVKTYAYTAGALTSETKWVKQ